MLILLGCKQLHRILATVVLIHLGLHTLGNSMPGCSYLHYMTLPSHPANTCFIIIVPFGVRFTALAGALCAGGSAAAMCGSGYLEHSAFRVHLSAGFFRLGGQNSVSLREAQKHHAALTRILLGTRIPCLAIHYHLCCCYTNMTRYIYHYLSSGHPILRR